MVKMIKITGHDIEFTNKWEHTWKNHRLQKNSKWLSDTASEKDELKRKMIYKNQRLLYCKQNDT